MKRAFADLTNHRPATWRRHPHAKNAHPPISENDKGIIYTVPYAFTQWRTQMGVPLEIHRLEKIFRNPSPLRKFFDKNLLIFVSLMDSSSLSL